MDEQDRRQLLGFVSDVEATIERALVYVPEPDMADLAFTAFGDLRERGEFERLHNEIASSESDQRLDQAGLSGAQLVFKLAVIDRRRSDVQAAEETAEEPGEPLDQDPQLSPQRQSSRGRRLRGLIVKLLDAIDTVLDSLVGALHGAGEIIKELKLALENWLTD